MPCRKHDMKQKNMIPGLAGGFAAFALFVVMDAVRGIPITRVHALYLLLCMLHSMVASVFYGTFLARADGRAIVKGTVFGLFCGILIVRPVMLYGHMEPGIFNMLENIMAYTLMGITIAMTAWALESTAAGSRV